MIEYVTQIMKLEDSLADNGNKMRLGMQICLVMIK